MTKTLERQITPTLLDLNLVLASINSLVFSNINPKKIVN